jgi:hypothetical protein
VKWRLCWFRDRYPHGVITTDEICVDLERGYARYKATVTDGQGGSATGYGTETAAEFADYCERAETRALGRALAALGIGTQFVGQDLTEGDHVADAPVRPPASSNGHAPAPPLPPDAGEPTRLTSDQARDLKKLAQTAFGFADGERRLRADLGFAEGERLTLRHLCAHVTPAQAQTLMDGYTALLRQAVEADLPDFPPPAADGQAAGTPVDDLEPSPPTAVVPANGTPVPLLNGQPEPTPDDRLRWGALSRRSMQVGLSATTWDALRQGDYAAAERVIVALEGPGQP